MPVTQKDIAQRLGISQQVVACALNGKGGSRMSDITRARILDEVNRLGYRPNLAARALTKQRTHLIAVWTRNFTTSYYACVLQEIEAQLRRSNYEMIVRVLPYASDQLHDFDHVQEWQAAQWPVDGILAIESAQVAHHFLNSGPGVPPVVCLGGYDPRLPHLDYVWFDMYEGTLAAVRHLLEQGCRRVAMLLHVSGYEAGNMRFEAYNRAIEEAGLQPEYILIEGNTRKEGSMALKAHIEQHGCPDGLFCYNDDFAIGAYSMLCQSGFKIPEDIALVGCDGVEDKLWMEKSLSTIVAPIEAMCARSWELLQERMEARDVDTKPTVTHEVLRAHLEIRESSRRKP